ncbi:MAG: LysE family translocator [Candidatus Wallbacteria bacterium]|nr:LysE family translocator [Candidatus Wallbacteria bacterium]
MAAFFLSSLLLALCPGPDNLFVLTQALLYGPGAGIMVTAGLCTGLIGHTAAVALGVSAVFQLFPASFTALKVCGAFFLLYLAVHAIRSSSGTNSPDPGKTRLKLSQLYRRGIIMNLTNPKVSLFFLAFLPQFADPSKGSLTLQLSFLGIVFAFATILVFGSISILAGSAAVKLQNNPLIFRIMNLVAATIYLLLAARLIFM